MSNRLSNFGERSRRAGDVFMAAFARGRQWIVGGHARLPTDKGGRDHALIDAIASNELLLEYQPKLHLRQQRITSLEALVRWQNRERGLLYPNSFISDAEESGDIEALTLWVLDRAIADQRQFAAAGHDLPIFVNMAASLLADDDFVTVTCSRVRSSGARIGLEITETSVIRDPAAAIGNLKRVAALGIPVAIDDYGAGLSSLAYLKQLPACELKIDKLFITELTSSQRDPLIVRSTIDLAHAMEMEVVAEGVESQAALALLSIMGCDMAQGYLISRPMRFEAALEFLATQSERSSNVSTSFAPVSLRRQA